MVTLCFLCGSVAHALDFDITMALGLLTVDIAYLPLRQDLLAKNVLMTAQRDFHLVNRPPLVISPLGSSACSRCSLPLDTPLELLQEPDVVFKKEPNVVEA